MNRHVTPARTPLLALAATLASGLLALPGVAQASSCHNLKLTDTTRRALVAAHHRATKRPFTGPRKGSTYYGRCGSTYYALASFNDYQLGYTDQPEAFRKTKGHRWFDRGDTGGDVCTSAPRALRRIWRLTCYGA
jgi:hypothetical protein